MAAVGARRRESAMFTAADGTRLAWRAYGPADPPLTVVLAHGWTLRADSWQRVALRLAVDRGVRVVCYDHRGHGDSDPLREGTATIAQLADDLAAILDAVTSGPVVLAGHSMGGMTIMALAERHPELVADRVVGVGFVATSCGDLLPLRLGLPPYLARLVASGEAAMRRRQAARIRWDRPGPPPRIGARPVLLAPGIRWLLFGRRPRPADIAMTSRMVVGCRPASVVGFRAEFDRHDRRGTLAAFAGVPTAVLAGAADRLTPPRHARTIADELPHAELVVYPDAGHMLPLERAEQVAARIADLCDRAGDRPRDASAGSAAGSRRGPSTPAS